MYIEDQEEREKIEDFLRGYGVEKFMKYHLENNQVLFEHHGALFADEGTEIDGVDGVVRTNIGRDFYGIKTVNGGKLEFEHRKPHKNRFNAAVVGPLAKTLNQSNRYGVLLMYVVD